MPTASVGPLAAETWGDRGPAVVLLHSGVTGRDGWRRVADLLAADHRVVAYDRRGFGDSPPGDAPFTHVDDLLAVLDALADGPVHLVGCSMGGGLALDTALTAPKRIASVTVIGSAVSGAPEQQDDEATDRIAALLEAAEDLDEVNRLEAWLWLDGPSSPEGRVTGAARELFLRLNAIALLHEDAEHQGRSGVDAWSRAGELDLPVLVACGDLDLSSISATCAALAERLPRAEHRVLPGRAHLPHLEDPAAIAGLVRARTAR